MKNLYNFQNALSSDFKLCTHLRTGILHFVESKLKFQKISKNFFHPPFQEKTHFWHNSGAVATITQPTKVLISRYTAGFISDNISR